MKRYYPDSDEQIKNETEVILLLFLWKMSIVNEKRPTYLK